MKNNTPKISIILPCYNGADMLGGAIESVQAQTFKDWELIIVNDCSTDNTLEVANAYAAKDERIRVFSNEHNSKLPATLNHGFCEARGEYWTWTSDDNLLLPDYCQELSHYLDEHPEVGFVVGDEYSIDADGNIIGTVIKPDNLRSKLPLNNYVGATFMYRREIAQQAGEYRTDLFLVEDYEYWLRMSFLTEMGHVNKILYKYRHHDRSLTATRKQEIAERLVRMRLMYRTQVEKQMNNHQELLSLFYFRIVDNLSGSEKWKYILEFGKRLPYHFAIRYFFVHLPHKLLKS